MCVCVQESVIGAYKFPLSSSNLLHTPQSYIGHRLANADTKLITAGEHLPSEEDEPPAKRMKLSPAVVMVTLFQLTNVKLIFV